MYLLREVSRNPEVFEDMKKHKYSGSYSEHKFKILLQALAQRSILSGGSRHQTHE